MSFWGSLGFPPMHGHFLESLTYSNEFFMAFIATSIGTYIFWYTMSDTSSFSLTNKEDKDTPEAFVGIIPLVLLFSLGAPALQSLMFFEGSSSDMKILIEANQWYWHYEYDSMNMELDSFMSQPESLYEGEFRNLEVDNRLILPSETWILLDMTSNDVIHSWAMPSLATKVDCIPGRHNYAPIYIEYPGVFYGQCSELCGANHSFMPISVEAIPMNYFMKWILNFTEN